MKAARTIVVSGMVAAVPGQGGATWSVLQYLLGLARLGHEVYFVEPLDDADLPPDGRTFSLSGVAELSTVNRAVGVLINQGNHPDDAHESLRGHAARAGLEPYDWATRLLQRTRAGRLE